MMPLISLFLVDYLKTAPAFIGIFTVSVAISGIGFNYVLGNLLDKGIDAKKLFLVSATALCASAFAFATITNIWVVLVVGVILFSLGNASIPLLLGMIRLHADQSGLNSAKLNAQMRSGVSMVWIVGPPIAFTLVGAIGFPSTYYTAALLILVVIALTFWFLPSFYKKNVRKSTDDKEQPIPLTFWMLGLMIVMVNTSNSLYMTSMPLFVTQELMHPNVIAGLLMGLTAAIEIPIMLMAPRLGIRFGQLRVTLVAIAMSVVFYGAIGFTSNIVGLVALQVLNGLYFGMFVGLGITIIQDALTERVGFASAFYTNGMRIGSMVGSASAGILAQFIGFHLAVYGAMVSSVLAFLCLLWVVKAPSNTTPLVKESA